MTIASSIKNANQKSKAFHAQGIGALTRKPSKTAKRFAKGLFRVGAATSPGQYTIRFHIESPSNPGTPLAVTPDTAVDALSVMGYHQGPNVSFTSSDDGKTFTVITDQAPVGGLDGKFQHLGNDFAYHIDYQNLDATKAPLSWKGLTTQEKIWSGLSVVSSAAGAYHGYKRNDSVGWAIWWSFMGGLFPVITPVVAVAQGFGKPKGK